MTSAPATTTPTTPPGSKRRWFQFSLRTMFVLVTILAVAMGWLMHYVQQLREVVRLEREAVAEIEKLGGSVVFAQQPQYVLRSLPNWLRTVLGDDDYLPVTRVSLEYKPITDADLAHLYNFAELQELNLRYTKITDAGVQHLHNLIKLQSLNLAQTKITDATLKHLSKFDRLEYLNLNSTLVTDSGMESVSKIKSLNALHLFNTKITDQGLTHICQLITLNSLSLDSTCITDAGLLHMKKMTGLQSLWLNDTEVTVTGFTKIKDALPECHIDWSPLQNTNP